MARLERMGVGAMLTPKNGYRRLVINSPTLPFGCDTGLYSANGERSFDFKRYLSWLDRLPRDRCLFATAPDAPGDWASTLSRSLPALSEIRRLGFPVALCAQNGADEESVPWSEIDVLFLGGMPEPDGKGRQQEWKTSLAAWALTATAQARGTPVHMGRCNSLRRLRTAQLMGCASADGTFLAKAPLHNIPRIERWLDELQRQPPLRAA